MADPQHVPELDGFDRLTVRLYRAGLAVSALGLLTLAAVVGLERPGADRAVALGLITVGVGLSVANMHLYDKRVRWVIGASGWIGMVLLVASGSMVDALRHWVHHAGLGFVFVCFSAFALKEQFCFKIPLLRLVPAVLAVSLIPLLSGSKVPAAVLLGLAGLVYAALAVAKARMPLHFDVGNKGAYQV